MNKEDYTEIKGIKCYSPELAFENDGFDIKSFEKLFNVEEKSFWFNSRNKIIEWALTKYFGVFDNFLEVGCGTGFVISHLANQFPNTKFTGSEIYLEGIKFAKERNDLIEFIQLDATHIPFKNKYSIIGAFDVIEHIENDELVLKNMYNAIKPNGGIILTVPQHKWMWS